MTHAIHITADQFLAQCDATLQALVQQQPSVPPGYTTKLRECFLGTFYAMKAHEHALSAAHDDIRKLTRYVDAIVQTHGLEPAKRKAQRARSASADMIVTGQGGGGGTSDTDG